MHPGESLSLFSLIFRRPPATVRTSAQQLLLQSQLPHSHPVHQPSAPEHLSVRKGGSLNWCLNKDIYTESVSVATIYDGMSLMWIFCEMNRVSWISLKAKNNHLFLSKNLDHRKKPPHVNHSGTLPPDWKRTSCFSDLGETPTYTAAFADTFLQVLRKSFFHNPGFLIVNALSDRSLRS